MNLQEIRETMGKLEQENESLKQEIVANSVKMQKVLTLSIRFFEEIKKALEDK